MASSRRARLRNQKWFLAFLKDNPCVDCGESNPVLLELDHVRGDKKLRVSRLVQTGYSLKCIEEEIAKCVVRCVRCHRLRTANEENWYDYEESDA